MNAKWLVVGLAALVTCLVTTEVFAKREAPAPVASVRLNQLEFIAPHKADGHYAPGYIEGRDVETGNLIWRRQIYAIIYEPLLERDVQDVFITELAVESGRNVLKIANENGDTYEMELQTLEVKATKGSVLLRPGKRCRC